MKEEIIFKEDSKIKVKKPKMYKVILHNDDYTTMEFVIEVLVMVFNKKPAEASKIMYDVHKRGIGIAGVYSYDIATTKIAQVMDMAEKSGFPLKLSMEEE
ncbi:ATP-dependent Clp protease adaptor ClpS [Clostridium ganghwense]|uniref:ATP-dependent Clp protease adapter protein ClpS n=1 Tax=Clostridium ganghwense TaxID=312089 RepID=A0ABT4CJS6_9CLOT|nr:ATP-dependent Clp protease adaptor ClpS [Clostridium ganghwense]MCY6369168.1 ATP-dependent Clp protease adaptor ClpS [Clostridium ganghwense]